MNDSLNYRKYKTLSPLPEESKIKFEKNIAPVQSDCRKPGQDNTPMLTISFMEAVQGVEKEVIIPVHSFCRTCDSTGKVNGRNCSLCDGKKVIVTPKRILVNIPAGIDNGQYLALNGGAMSKVRIKVNVENHPKFERKGYDIHSVEYYDAPEDVGSYSMELEVLDGKPILRGVTKMTEDGTQLCYKGRGIPMLKDKNIRGDHYITLRKRPLIHEEQRSWVYLYDSLNKNGYLCQWEIDEIYRNLGDIFETGGELLALGDSDYGVKLLKLAAMHGESQAKLLLGYCYEQGIGVLKDIETAKEYCRSGTRKDMEYRKYYENGELTEEGYEEAFQEGHDIYLSF